MALTNKNCLAHLCCPQCGSEGPLRIEATATFLVYDDGTECSEGHEGITWAPTANCECQECGHASTVQAFLDGATLWATTVTCLCCSKEAPATTAHLQQGYVGDCCWQAYAD